MEMSMPPIEGGGSKFNVDYEEEARTFLRFGWPPKLTDNIRTIKVRKDCTGVLFDLWEDRVDQFMDYYQDLCGKGQDRGVVVKRCTVLPEMEDDDEGAG